MSEITIFLLYVIAATACGASRLPRFAAIQKPLFIIAALLIAIGIAIHGKELYASILVGTGFNLSLGNVASLVGLELALIGLIAALEPSLRGISASLLLLGAVAATATGLDTLPAGIVDITWQVRVHVLIAVMSYGLLTVGAIVALYAIVQERQLRTRQLSSLNRLFAPLETTEALLFAITAAGFAGLSLAIVSGLTFVENLFAQHLVHKTAFSILALFVFGALLVGRHFYGWRGTRAIKLYLGGFILLCFAYFGARLILEQILGRSWS